MFLPILPRLSASKWPFLIIFVALGATLVGRAADPLPPELAALDTQFLALQAERVTGPFEAEVKKLNAAYLARVGEMLEAERAVGNLDGIEAFSAEQFDFASKETIPEKDDAKTPPALQEMRTIYRESLAKLVATREESRQTLIAPLAKRLQQMEVDFAKANRIPEAKVVRAYRETLGTEVAGVSAGGQVAATSPAPIAPAAGPMPSTTKLDPKVGFENSLGMKFVPVPGTEVLFCIHEVRYKDYAAYAGETEGVDGKWKDQSINGFTQADRGEGHPVIRLRSSDAQDFCSWLSKKEGKVYRLPTDEEWSIAVGIGRQEEWRSDTTPSTVSKDQSEFPWGREWSAPKGAGNYSDESRRANAPHKDAQYLDGYFDSFPTTAPVMSFTPNEIGLYDMGGNVSELVQDWYSDEQKERVYRGGSWARSGRDDLLSSRRARTLPDFQGNEFGFRVVVVPSEAGR